MTIQDFSSLSKKDIEQIGTDHFVKSRCGNCDGSGTRKLSFDGLVHAAIRRTEISGRIKRKLQASINDGSKHWSSTATGPMVVVECESCRGRGYFLHPKYDEERA